MTENIDYCIIRCVLTKLEKFGDITINEAIITIDEIKERLKVDQ